tara:strand:- start:22 stop:801 length:780 start_codon:yes stop_codon:yes gene_type:complete
MLALKQGLSLETIKALGGGAAFSNVYSLDFDGVDDFVNFGDNSKFSISSHGGFTISVWIKASADRRTILSKFVNSATEAEYNLIIGRSAKLEFYVYGGGSNAIYQFLSLNTPTLDGDWHHVAATFDKTDSSDSIYLYLDGVEYAGSSGATTYGSAGTWAASTNTTSPLQLGSVMSADYFSGNIDELAIFGSVKTGAEISSIYNSGTPTDLSGESNLVGYWRNGDTDGTSVYPTIEDYGPFGNDGTMTNMVSGDIVTVVP